MLHSIWSWSSFEPKILQEIYSKLEKIHLIRIDYETILPFLLPLNDEDFLAKDMKLKEFIVDLHVVEDETVKYSITRLF